MHHTLIKLKLTLLGVFGAGVVATIIGKGRLKEPKIQNLIKSESFNGLSFKGI